VGGGARVVINEVFRNSWRAPSTIQKKKLCLIFEILFIFIVYILFYFPFSYLHPSTFFAVAMTLMRAAVQLQLVFSSNQFGIAAL